MNDLWLIDNLTVKQRFYVAQLASGKSTLQIATDNYVSHHTVRNTITKAKERIGANSTANLIATAIEKEWINKTKDGPPMIFEPDE